MRHRWRVAALSSLLLARAWVCSAQGAEPLGEETLPPPAKQPAQSCAGSQALQGPILSPGQPLSLVPAQPEETDRPLPINLATALRLADARPLVIAAAQTSLRTALAQYDEAKLLWLPNVYVGASYFRHDGGAAGNHGIEFINGRDQFLAGGGLLAIVSTADALFAPLALRQVVRARTIEIQAARNDALEAVALAYFDVQEARGRLAGSQDAVEKARKLAHAVEVLGKGLAAPIEVNRARTELAAREQAEAAAREQWRFASANLARTLRLDPAAVVVPLEPLDLQVTLLSPQEPVDELIPIGLTSRPELAAQQALVQATLARLRQERLRPLIPSLVLEGEPTPAAPGGFLMGGVFGSDVSGHGNPWTARNDVNVQLLWEMRNLGFGNRALVRERQAEQQQAVIELYRIQDLVAAEVAQAHAQVRSAAVRVAQAEVGLKEAQMNYAGNLKGMSETTRFGPLLTLVNRPQEVVAALEQLAGAYDHYFTSINDYNRAQFRLYRALGYPAGILACERSPGEIKPVDTARPPQMAPVCAPEPCRPTH